MEIHPKVKADGAGFMHAPVFSIIDTQLFPRPEGGIYSNVKDIYVHANIYGDIFFTNCSLSSLLSLY